MTRRRTVTALVAAAALILAAAPGSHATGSHATGAAPAPRAPVTDLSLELTSTAEPVTGDMVTFAGTAPKSLDSATVVLRRGVGKMGEWVKVGTGVVADGSFSVSGVATGSGLNRWRATLKRNGTLHRSPVVKTTVYAWYYLYRLNPVDYTDLREGSFEVGGTTYAKSVASAGVGGYGDWIEYNMGYKCKTFESWNGLDDQDTDTGALATFSLGLDGAETNLGTKGLGTASKVSVDVSSRLRIRLELTYDTDPDAELFALAVWGNARVLCAGKP